jgi:hypothetical protein
VTAARQKFHPAAIAAQHEDMTMSDASLPHCEKCNQPEYACICDEGKCLSREPAAAETLAMEIPFRVESACRF